MITVRIGEEEREFVTADEQWINQQINRRRADGQAVCVRVTVRQNGLDMILSTAACGGGGGAGRPRPPNPQEKEVFDLWDRRGLNDTGFTGGNLVAFLKQLSQLL